MTDDIPDGDGQEIEITEPNQLSTELVPQEERYFLHLSLMKAKSRAHAMMFEDLIDQTSYKKVFDARKEILFHIRREAAFHHDYLAYRFVEIGLLCCGLKPYDQYASDEVVDNYSSLRSKIGDEFEAKFDSDTVSLRQLMDYVRTRLPEELQMTPESISHMNNSLNNIFDILASPLTPESDEYRFRRDESTPRQTVVPLSDVVLPYSQWDLPLSDMARADVTEQEGISRNLLE